MLQCSIDAWKNVHSGYSRSFAKVTICAKLPLVQMAFNGSSQPKADMPVRHFGRRMVIRCSCEGTPQLREKRTLNMKIECKRCERQVWADTSVD
jgi:hypothetical protein